MQMMSNNFAGLVSAGFGAAVLILVLIGFRHGALRRQQLRWATNLASQSKQKLLEVQHAQLEASLSMVGGRDAVAERMRSSKF